MVIAVDVVPSAYSHSFNFFFSLPSALSTQRLRRSMMEIFESVKEEHILNSNLELEKV